jgi:hypothetical protein
MSWSPPPGYIVIRRWWDGAPADKAEKAAEEVAGYENRLAKLEADLTLLKWMFAANIALSLIILGKLLV